MTRPLLLRRRVSSGRIALHIDGLTTIADYTPPPAIVKPGSGEASRVFGRRRTIPRHVHFEPVKVELNAGNVSWKESDVPDQHQIVDWPCVGNDELHSLESQLFQSVAVLLKI